MAGKKLLKIRVSLKGRPIKSYTFNKDVVRVGRNPESEIYLDNPGISRDHLKLEMTSRGLYAVEDLGSANGTYLNDQPIRREYVMNNDVLQVGKYTLWMSYEEDRRNLGPNKKDEAQAFQGTTILSADEMEEMVHSAQEAERAARLGKGLSEEKGPRGRFPSRHFLGALIVLSFVLGTLIGPVMPWMHP
jgi:hypothetical protein